MKKIVWLMIIALALFVSPVIFAQDVVTFEVHVDKVKFDPPSVTVKKGQKVSITFISDDVAHGIHLKKFRLQNTIIPAKESVTLEFTADEVGTYDSPCTKYCSWRHFVGKRPRFAVIVEE